MLKDIPSEWKGIVAQLLLNNYIGSNKLPRKNSTEWHLLLHVIDKGTQQSLDSRTSYKAHIHDGGKEIPWPVLKTSLDTQGTASQPLAKNAAPTSQKQIGANETVEILNKVALQNRTVSQQMPGTEPVCKRPRHLGSIGSQDATPSQYRLHKEQEQEYVAHSIEGGNEADMFTSGLVAATRSSLSPTLAPYSRSPTIQASDYAPSHQNITSSQLKSPYFAHDEDDFMTWDVGTDTSTLQPVLRSKVSSMIDSDDEQWHLAEEILV